MKRRQAFWPRFRYTLRHRKGWGGWLLSAALGIGLAFFMIHHFDAALRPQLLALAETQLRNQLTHIADQTVSQVMADQGLSYQDMVTLKTGQSSELTTFTTDSARLNLFRSAAMESIVSQVEAIDDHSLGVPLGALTGVDLFAAIGPTLPVRVFSVISAQGDYRNDFISAGINQTLHRIMLDITISAKLLLPGGVEETELSVPICIAETVIIGQVPQTYLTLNQ